MKTVMVVDDSRIMREIVKKTFEILEIPSKFIEAGDGHEALRQIQEQTVNLVLLDRNMPVLSGIDFLKRARAMDQYKSLPIIMVTGESAKYDIIEALEAGATDYIVKPVSEKIFIDKLSKVIF